MRVERDAPGLLRSRSWRDGAALTVAVSAFVAVVAWSGLLPDPIVRSLAPVMLLAAVMYAGFLGGMSSGLVSAGIGIAYYAYLVSIPGRPFVHTRDNLRAVLVVAVAYVVVGLAVGFLSERLRRAMARERERQRMLEETAAELETTVEELRSRTEDAEAVRADLEVAAVRSRFLAEASRTVAASLDYGKTLESLGRLVVEALADLCIVDVVEEGGTIRRVAVPHADPARQALADELMRYPPDPNHPAGVPEVLRTGRPVLMERISDARLEAIALDAEHLRIMRELEPGSVIIVPLLARGRTLGAMTMVLTEGGRHYRADDLELAEELARRAAIAVDNARLYRNAEEASRAKSNFLAVMSHELRTPLNAIIGYTELLAAGMMGPLTDEQHAKLERVKANAQHLLELIEEILGFAGVQAGSEGITIERMDLGEIVRAAVETIEPMARDKGLRLSVDLPEGPMVVETDPGKVRQILVHLLSNAVKFTEEGEVRVAAELNQDRLKLEVRDTGIGIPAEALEKVFESFWQVEQVSTRSAGGTGLGLTVARQLSRLLGGDISVESSLGRGSTFTVDLPARAQARRLAADGAGL